MSEIVHLLHPDPALPGSKGITVSVPAEYVDVLLCHGYTEIPKKDEE